MTARVANATLSGRERSARAPALAAVRYPRGARPRAAPSRRARRAGAAVSSGRCSWSARSSATITTCSSSAPLKPSAAATIRGRSRCSGSCLRSDRWMRRIASRSAASGRSTKKISSKRPLRSSSGGSAERSLAVATTKTSVALLLQPRQKRAEQAPAEPAVGVAVAARRHALLDLVDPQDDRCHRLRGRQRATQVLLGLAHVLVVEATGVQLQQRQLPFTGDRPSPRATCRSPELPPASSPWVPAG